MTEQEITFRLLRSALNDTTPDVGVLEPQQWWSLFRLLQRNHVAALVSEVFDKMPKEMLPPRAVLIPWLAERDKEMYKTTSWTHCRNMASRRLY